MDTGWDMVVYIGSRGPI
ncbi:hypothetical protein F383_21984 [Gossypium arboreum]|uniref:Uncharacterized protein n=1 Tax=Gossypium arboreum TaxID=29729 RepID=A0A0B0NW38_GOSAR|nr:hypothetical protein F383_21984 [Gossypium arboreum]